MRRHLRRAKATIKYTPSFESSCPDPGCKPYNTKAAIAKVRVDPRLSDKEKRYRVNKLIQKEYEDREYFNQYDKDVTDKDY